VVKLLYKENLVLYEAIENFYSQTPNITEPSRVNIEQHLKSLQNRFRNIAKNIENLG